MPDWMPKTAEEIWTPKSAESADDSKPQGLLTSGNIDLYNRPKVKNSDGSVSTVKSMSFNEDGKEILVPTVSDDGKIVSDQEAINNYHKTGKHLGIFDNPDNATKYAQQLHNDYASGKYDSKPQISNDTSIFKGGLADSSIPLKTRLSNLFFGTSKDSAGHDLQGQEAGPEFINKGTKYLADKIDNPNSADRGVVRPFLAGALQGVGNVIKTGLDPRAAMIKPVPRINPEAIQQGVQATKDAYDLAGLNRPSRLALPPYNPPREPFIGGPSGASGEVLAASKANPADAAKLAGLSGDNIPSSPSVGEGFNTHDISEAARQNKLSYTAAEHYLGSRLSLPDPPSMQSPPSPGDTTLGFSQRGKLDTYPYNVVPDKLRPRAVQGDVSNVVPDRMKIGSIPEGDNDLGFTSGGKEITESPNPPKKPDYYIGDPDAPAQLPSAREYKPSSAEPISTEQIKPTAKGPNGSTIPLKGKAKQIIDNTNTVDNQDVKDVVQSAVQDPSFQERFNKSLVGRSYDALGTSTETQLNDLSPNLGMAARRAQLDGDSLSGQLKNAYHKIVDGLDDKQWSNVQQALDGKNSTNLSNTESNAVNGVRKILDSLGMQGQEVGLGMKNAEGRTVPLALRQDYFPHTYDPEVLAQFKQDPSKIAEILAKQGKSPAEIDQIMKNARQFNERMLNSQNAREADIPGYKTDKSVIDSYIHNMSRRVEQARNFGPQDIGDINSPAMQMIRESKDPEKATDLMKIVTGRTAPASKLASEVSDKITSAEAAVHLSTSALSHINAPQFILLQSSTKNFLKGGLESISNLEKAGDLAKDSGAWENIRSALTGAPESFKFTDLFGLHKAQQIPRAWAAVTGRLEAEEAFQAFKQDPGNAVVAERLKNLILEEPNSLLKQESLTTKQLNRASGRMSQLSQGLSDKLDKPPTWNGPVAKIMTQFHNYAFSQTKNTWAALRANPVRNIPLLAGTMIASGELSGDSKAALKGLAKGMIDGKPIQNMQDEINNRGNWIKVIKDHPSLQRLSEDIFQSWALGIPLDLAKAASSGGNALLGAVAGPAAQDAVRGVDDINAVRTGKTAFNKVRPTMRDIASKIPFVGSGFSSAIPVPDRPLRP